MTRALRQRRSGGYRASADSGFSLVEMAIVLLTLGLIAVLVFALLPRLTERMRLDTTDVQLQETAEAILGFLKDEDRLPCPDVDNNGTEGAAGTCDPAHQVGTVPFRTLGLPGPVLDQARLPLRYAVYRNAGADADLVTLDHLYEPDLPGALDIEAGTVANCALSLDDVVRIIYFTERRNILTVSGASGPFQVGEYVSGSTLDFNNVVPNTPSVVPIGDCPCGNNGVTCNQCNTFVAGETVFLSSQADDQPPNAEIHSVSGSTLILPFPTGTFAVGSVIEGSQSGVTATVTDFHFPGIAEITEVVTANQVYAVTLTPTDSVFYDAGSGFGFNPGQLLFGQASGASATYVSLAPDPANQFSVGETVTGATSGATGTLQGDTGTTLTLSNVNGTFIGPTIVTPDPDGPPSSSTAGETITGGTSGAEAQIAWLTEGGLSEPTISYGSLTIGDPTPSLQLNRLDFCKATRNGIGTPHSIVQVHTVNGAGVVMNPAYLLASGGVEDADGDGVDFHFDGLNENPAAPDFEAPARGRDAGYDDRVWTRSMHGLDQQLACPARLGVVNALAGQATNLQNIAISSFNNNENALAAIAGAWAGLKLAEASVAIEVANTLLAAAECAKGISEAILTKGASAAAVAAACIAAAGAVVNFAFAVDALVSAGEYYEFTCDDQLETATALFQAESAFIVALQQALDADIREGVR